jgi:putative thioredoxin
VDGPDIITADDSNFEFQVLEYSEILPVVVDFWAKWCLDCQRVSEALETLAAHHVGRFRLAQVDVDGSPRLTKGYQVHTVPTIKTFQNGVVISQLEGVQTNLKVEEYIKKHIPGPESLLLEKAASYLQDAQYLSVEDTCLEILEEDPDNPGAKLLLVKSLLWQGSYLEALTTLQGFPASSEYQAAEKLIPLAKGLLSPPGLDLSGEPLEAIYQRALTLIRDGQIPAALDGLLEILKQDKDFRGESPREVILGIFELLGEEHPITEQYRPQLANTLF